ncbi:MAG: hypothetical protein LBQ09_00665 [Acidobacteriaceae bacterium]|jgi:hypothetical protein|nr:hypothetical protein [Acidobacteriaceae bacterium]
MKKPLTELTIATVLCGLLTILVTWPHLLHFGSALFEHQDSYFSIWRLAWVAHALKSAPLDLLNGNVFYPAERTLTYSDAMLVQGVLAAPLFWIGAPPIAIYNTMLLAGFIGCGVGVYVLARHLTGAMGPALVAAAAFTMAPYRIEHIMHLEMQWAMWVPLTLWALHVACETSSVRMGALAGLFFALQVLSCVYYSVFLALLLVVFVPLLVIATGRVKASLAPLTAAAVTALLLAAPYALQYARTADVLGGRNPDDIAQYSAHLSSYLTSSSYSRLWGWTADLWGSGDERRLFPGLVVTLLAVAGIFSRHRRTWTIYAVVAITAITLSLGVNGPVYRWLLDHITFLEGLRAIARMGLLAACALAVMAALGADALATRVRRISATGITVACLLAIAVESSTTPLDVSGGSFVRDSDVYRMLNTLGPGVVVELPMPRANELPGPDPFYALWSRSHWHPLVNGYSGYYPSDYIQTLARMEYFPEEASIANLHAHDVRYIVLHREFFKDDQYSSLMLRMAQWPQFTFWGVYRDPVGVAALWVMEPAP